MLWAQSTIKIKIWLSLLKYCIFRTVDRFAPSNRLMVNHHNPASCEKNGMLQNFIKCLLISIFCTIDLFATMCWHTISNDRTKCKQSGHKYWPTVLWTYNAIYFSVEGDKSCSSCFYVEMSGVFQSLLLNQSNICSRLLLHGRTRLCSCFV